MDLYKKGGHKEVHDHIFSSHPYFFICGFINLIKTIIYIFLKKI